MCNSPFDSPPLRVQAEAGQLEAARTALQALLAETEKAGFAEVGSAGPVRAG